MMLKIGFRQHNGMSIVDNMMLSSIIMSVKVILSTLSNELTVTIIEMKE